MIGSLNEENRKVVVDHHKVEEYVIIRAGLFGFNGVLVGIGLSFLLQLQWSAALIVYIIIAGIFSTIVFIALANFFSTWDMPALTAPFVLTAWLFLLPGVCSLEVHSLFARIILFFFLPCNARSP